MALRVLLNIEPRLLAGLIQEELQADEELDVTTSSGGDLGSAIADAAPDVVITNAPDGELSEASLDFLYGAGRRLVLGVQVEDETHHPATLFTLRPEGIPLGDLAPGTLAAAIRRYAQGGVGS